MSTFPLPAGDRQLPWHLRGSLARGFAILGLLIAVAVAAPVVSPYDPDQQIDPAATRLLPPGSQRSILQTGPRPRAAELVEATDQGFRYLRLGIWESVETPGPIPSETRRYWLGTDRYGRDLASRIVYGTRVSLRIGLVTALLALSIGLLIGSLAGWMEGWADALLMRSADALFAFPQLFLVLAAAAVWRAGELAVIVILAATSWMEVARLTRGEVRRLRRAPHVEAARLLGAGPVRVLTRHIAPLALPPLLVHTALRIGDVILIEAALSFLGFGVQPPTASWGNLLADATDEAWWIAVFPGLALVLTVLAFGLVADGVADRLDPQRTGRPVSAPPLSVAEDHP